MSSSKYYLSLYNQVYNLDLCSLPQEYLGRPWFAQEKDFDVAIDYYNQKQYNVAQLIFKNIDSDIALLYNAKCSRNLGSEDYICITNHCDFLFIERQSVFLFFIPKNNNRWKFLAGSLVPSKLGIRGLLPYFLLRWNCLRLKQFINSDRIDVDEQTPGQNESVKVK